MMRLLFAGLVLAVLATACSGRGSKPSATPSPIANVSSGVPGTPSATPPASATAGTVTAGYPLGASTGIPSLDALISILTSGDVAAVKSVLVETPSPCVVNPQGIHNPPACPDGVASGTLLPVFRASGGEALWPSDLDRVLQNTLARDRTLYGVRRSGPTTNQWIPPGDYIVLLGDATQTSSSIYFVTSTGVVGAIFVPWMSLPGVLDRFDSKADILPLRLGAAMSIQPTTGNATVDLVIAAVANWDWGRLVSLMRPTDVPCDNEYSIWPDCQGAPVGSPVPSVWSFQCEDGWVPLAPLLASPEKGVMAHYQLSAVTKGGPPVGRVSVVLPVDNWLLFDALDPGFPAAMAIAVANGRVIAWGNSCGDAGAFKLSYTAAASGLLVPAK